MGLDSLHDAPPDGYGYNSAPQSLTSLITPGYEPPAFDDSNGLCNIPPRMASMVYSHGIGRYYWGRGISVYGSLCNATCFAIIGITNDRFTHLLRPPLDSKDGTDTLKCWYSLTAACISVRPCFIALGASVIRKNFIIIPTIGPLLADESTPSMAYLAVNACQEPPTAVVASRGHKASPGRYTYPQYGLPGN
eukprot:6117464-Pleurochrysis_carterae.AAC.1